MPILKIKQGDSWVEVLGGVNLGSAIVDDTLSQIGHAADAKAVGDALKRSVADWNETDENSLSYIKNKPYEVDALEIVTELGLVSPVEAEDGSVYTDENGALYSL